ncbi:phosphomannomutase, partial [bacterium]|nr:phosphomannomutase [bacterium]
TFFKDRYYGFDDAVYAGCRLIEIVAKHKQKDSSFKLESLLTPFDKVYTSQEVRYRCPNDKKKAVLDALKSKVNETPNLFGSKIVDIVTIDGMRVIFEDGFALIRQSNTEPVFTLRFEAANKDKCEVYQNAMISALDKCMEIA